MRYFLRIALAALVATAALASPAVADDTGLSIVGRGQVAEITPDGAWEPAVTRAPNGDLLVAFPTSTDGGLGGRVMVTRSTDGGATWSTPIELYRPQYWRDANGNPNGASAMSVGMTTLRDGTILLPFSEVRTNGVFYNREAVMFVARSTDSGRTWSGLTTPIRSPQPIRETFQYGRIVELSDGTLLMPEWGALNLTADWRDNPEPWRAGILRSTDGGSTWSSFSTIAFDPNVSFDAVFNGGPNETSIEQLRDGRLVAAVRYFNPLEQFNVNMSRRLYVAYSSDRGLTWGAPQALNLQAQSPSLTQTPCSAGLGGTTTKLALGYRAITPTFGAGAISVSYNGGVTWQGQLLLQNPSGASFTSSYPAFQDLGGGRMIAVFMGQPSAGAPFRVYYNILQDDTATNCQAAADAAAQRDRDSVTVFVERQDRADWTFSYGLNQRTFAASTVIGAVAAREIGYPVACNEADALQLVRVRAGTPNVVLDQTRTFAANGVQTGDIVRVSAATAPSGALRIGFADDDHHPTDGEIVNWGTACRTARAGLDAYVRSFGIRASIPAGRAITSISLRSTGTATRLTSSDYTLYVSNDNRFYQQITGWTLSSALDGSGRLVHTFRGLNITQPYIKIHQPYDGNANITFILDNPHTDVTATFGP